ncbi:MAG: stage II sporulation protein D [Bacilli bacterium]|nr:stage II sporulation protein D [Bacilli bacterium]
MKKIIVTSILIVLIPFFAVKIFKRTDNIKYEIKSNTQIKVKDEKTGNIMEIPFEQYIQGVVSGEMPASFEMEALKAQAVAARSYALYHMNGKEYDVTNTTSNQVYLTEKQQREKWKEDYEEKSNKIKKAVIETNGQYLTYDGKTANAMFFAASVGKTENSEEVFSSTVPYLRSVSSQWDEEAPVYNDVVKISLKSFYEKLNLPYNETLNIEILEKTSTGRIKILKINNEQLNGREVASKLSLRSNYFEIKKEGENLIVNTKGYGHGVGLSQYGANGMAKEGYKYDEILKHYYEGTEIKKM